MDMNFLEAINELEKIQEGNTRNAEQAFANGEITQADIDACDYFWQLAAKLGYNVNGSKVAWSARQQIFKYAEKYGLDLSKFGATSPVPKKGFGMSNAEWFVKGEKRNGTWTIERLKLLGVPYKCDICGVVEWEGRPLSLQLHHKDGDHYNNEISNLQLLCPNCHSQTDTYARVKKALDKEEGNTEE